MDNCYTFELSILFQSILLLTTDVYNLLSLFYIRNDLHKVRRTNFGLASKCLMIDESRIVSVNKMDYLLRGTRANIWPQIDGKEPLGDVENFTVIRIHPN